MHSAWPVRPSFSAMRRAVGPSFFISLSSRAMMLLNLRKSCTTSGELKRALPLVGSAWLGPDGSFYSLSGPPTEQRMKMSLLVDSPTVIVDEVYSLYLISQP